MIEIPITIIPILLLAVVTGLCGYLGLKQVKLIKQVDFWKNEHQIAADWNKWYDQDRDEHIKEAKAIEKKLVKKKIWCLDLESSCAALKSELKSVKEAKDNLYKELIATKDQLHDANVALQKAHSATKVEEMDERLFTAGAQQFNARAQRVNAPDAHADNVERKQKQFDNIRAIAVGNAKKVQEDILRQLNNKNGPGVFVNKHKIPPPRHYASNPPINSNDACYNKIPSGLTPREYGPITYGGSSKNQKIT